MKLKSINLFKIHLGMIKSLCDCQYHSHLNSIMSLVTDAHLLYILLSTSTQHVSDIPFYINVYSQRSPSPESHITCLFPSFLFSLLHPYSSLMGFSSKTAFSIVNKVGYVILREQVLPTSASLTYRQFHSFIQHIVGNYSSH